jgi:hypothetical protein
MRVQDPNKYAEVMTGLGMPGHSYTAEQIRGMYGHSEIDLRFTTPIPVHITYQTAFVDEQGNLQTREDIYGRDATLISLLKSDRRGAETPVARAQPSYSRPSVRLPNGIGGDTNYSGGGSFFERLFGGNQQPQPAAQPQRPQRRAHTANR